MRTLNMLLVASLAFASLVVLAPGASAAECTVDQRLESTPAGETDLCYDEFWCPHSDNLAFLGLFGSAIIICCPDWAH